jgi:hypothetical protein
VHFDGERERMLMKLSVESFAAWWQSRYAGYVPKNSWFSFFQRLGMKWGKSVGV